MLSKSIATPPEAETAVHGPRGLLHELGVVGLASIEPVLIAALISGDPLLLIGAHGTGKSYLLERIATALGLEWRHYNASLLNFDDLAGFPVPDGDGNLRYIQTPASIWGAEAVFIDEISRCRPDMQNKLFPVIHERRVQGLPLERLRYRWSAMNPPAGDDDEAAVVYQGSEPLDPALADRFAFVVEMPGWATLNEAEREALILASGAPIDPAAARRLADALATGSRLFFDILHEQSTHLAVYIRIAVDLLQAARIELSGRRAALLLRNIAGVHAARRAVEANARLDDSAYLALMHSLPQPAAGIVVKGVTVLACHREAWRLAAVPPDDPMRRILAEPDPLRRALRAACTSTIEPRDVSTVVADALASLDPAGRHALAAWLFETEAAGRLVAAIAEQCGELYASVCLPQSVIESVYARSGRHQVWQRVQSVLAHRDPAEQETVLLSNLLAGMFNARAVATADDVDRAVASWDRVRSTSKAFL